MTLQVCLIMFKKSVTFNAVPFRRALAILFCACFLLPVSAGLAAKEAGPDSDSLKPQRLLVLNQADRDLYAFIFKKQAAGDMASADKAISKLDDQRLMGHVLFQRYLHPSAYTSRYVELKAWLEAYGDQPGADRIYNLALRKSANDHQKEALKKPVRLQKIVTRAEPTMVRKTPYHKQKNSDNGGKYDAALEKRVMNLIRTGRKDEVVDLLFELDRSQKYTEAEIDYLKAKAAESYLYKGRMSIAYMLAHQAFKRSGDQVAEAGWVCGLVSWHNGYHDLAARYFEKTAISPYASGWMQSAASYWAARSYSQLGERVKVGVWLTRAQAHPRTFYGLLALFAAGKPFDYHWETPRLSAEMKRALSDNKAAMRSMALLDVGRMQDAQQELVYSRITDHQGRMGVLALAEMYHMSELALRIGSRVYRADQTYYDGLLYPDVRISTAHGRQTDPDLLRAIMRQESRFDADAASYSGALGLMQLLPSTARDIAKRYDYALGSDKDLHNTQVNIELGQLYVDYLLKHPEVKGNVLNMLIAYNAGPGNLKRWRDLWANVEDPLLFIELLPASQTREYVEKVMANYWTYRIKHRRDLSAMADLAEGRVLSFAQITADLPFAVAGTRGY